MKRSGSEPPETAERRRRSGAAVLHAPTVPEAARQVTGAVGDQAFVVPIAEFDTP